MKVCCDGLESLSEENQELVKQYIQADIEGNEPRRKIVDEMLTRQGICVGYDEIDDCWGIIYG